MKAAGRRVRYQVAASLDGWITDDDGTPDWIVGDSDFDMKAHFAQFDTFLMGRRTYEDLPGGRIGAPGNVFVMSRTLRQEDHSHVTIVNGDARPLIERLKREEGKDIWLFGGGSLFRSLSEQGLVDTVEVALIPVLLGSGTPLMPGPTSLRSLKLTKCDRYPSGMIILEYDLL